MGTKSRTDFKYARSTKASTIEGSSRTQSWQYTNTRSRTGFSLKGYKTIIRSGGDATTVFSGTESRIQNISGSADGIIPKGMALSPPREPWLTELAETVQGSRIICSPFPLTSQGAIDPTKANNQAITRFNQSIRQKKSHFDAMTFLGEGRQSFHDLRSLVSKLANMVPLHVRTMQKLTARYIGNFVIGPNGSAVRVRNHNPFPSKKVEKTVKQKLADEWLAFSFGLSPLVSDIATAAEAVARYNLDLRQRTKVRGYGEDVQPVSQTAWRDLPFGLGHLEALVTERLQKRCTVIYRGQLAASDREITDPYRNISRMTETFGFTAEQFVPSIYNLIPYSWFVDYFSNLGDFLLCLTTDTSGLRWVCRTEISYLEKIATSQCSIQSGTPGAAAGGSFGGYYAYTKSVSRAPRYDLSVPMPTLEFQVPSYVSQVTNLVALLASGSKHPRGF